MNKFIFSFLLLLCSSINQGFAFDVKIVAIVNEEIITSYTLESRYKLTQIINGKNLRNAPKKEVENALLDRLIQEKILEKNALNNGFIISDRDVIQSMQPLLAQFPMVKSNSAIFESLKNQVKGEIIFSAMMQSYAKDKISNITNEEAERFAASYNAENKAKISLVRAKELLRNAKYNELQSGLLKNLLDGAVIEKKL
jgi:hypothetical protein